MVTIIPVVVLNIDVISNLGIYYTYTNTNNISICDERKWNALGGIIIILFSTITNRHAAAAAAHAVI